MQGPFMQSQTDIRRLLDGAGLSPNRKLGQCFMVDQNLLGKLLDLAEIDPDRTVLEVGPGTGTLTEELLDRTRRVVAVEFDRGLARLMAERFAGRENFTLIDADAMAGKHAINPDVLAALGDRADLVANLPYNIATPLVVELLRQNYAACTGRGGLRVGRLTFTVQKEVAARLAGRPGQAAYGQVSVLCSLLGQVELGPTLPAEAFWPRPKIASQIVRIDTSDARCAQLADADVLGELVNVAFGQRRKQIGSLARRRDCHFAGESIASALDAAGVAQTCRPEQIGLEQWLTMANRLAAQAGR
jgi:16S rRNA (adenine1518-N6/adenine1519-N6)-dimethyltransferase